MSDNNAMPQTPFDPQSGTPSTPQSSTSAYDSSAPQSAPQSSVNQPVDSQQTPGATEQSYASPQYGQSSQSYTQSDPQPSQPAENYGYASQPAAGTAAAAPQPNPYEQDHPYMGAAAPGQGAPYAQAGYAAPGQPYPPQGAYYGYPYLAPVNQRWNTLCIVGFILSFVFAPAGLVLSVIALIQINKSGEKSKGMSIAGIIIGAVNTILLVLIVALFMWAFEASVDMVHNGDIEFGNGGSSPTDCAVTINGECLSYGDLRKYGIDPDDLDDLSRLGLDLNSGSGRTTALSTVQ
ncbi:peptidyl-prolyl cis-trans isomerase [Bifidobacterium hapali]|uniref:Peptidyl-prolyl cis-trans isomerase n=1 Tax=Bifidobacterium hapali TaxID=1630172 RepID=A0A261FVL3_9BIFI|nr:DUF4190 domain-containing protein [Bifidobacterium hapali]OZG63227.1 peptidyl-prolyl cis-trans isomerase [Bifidobacterium hapali]